MLQEKKCTVQLVSTLTNEAIDSFALRKLIGAGRSNVPCGGERQNSSNLWY